MPHNKIQQDQLGAKCKQAGELLMSKQISQKEVAAILGVSAKTISNWIKMHNWK
jgi:transposase